jgi:hypothetical protein
MGFNPLPASGRRFSFSATATYHQLCHTSIPFPTPRPVSTLHPLIYTIVAFLLAFVATFFWKRYDATQKEQEERAAKEKSLHGDLLAVRSDLGRLELRFQGDLAAVADILKRFVAINDKLTTMAERMDWHGKMLERHDGDFQTVHAELKVLQTDIKKLLSHA